MSELHHGNKHPAVVAASQPTAEAPAKQSVREKTKRSSKACNYCRKSKRKCDAKGPPCGRCMQIQESKWRKSLKGQKEAESCLYEDADGGSAERGTKKPPSMESAQPHRPFDAPGEQMNPTLLGHGHSQPTYWYATHNHFYHCPAPIPLPITHRVLQNDVADQSQSYNAFR
ncbi:hypothetical protein AYL99_11790 [Fonsecaea erecta]|uniref:Zn(2)-C6 fungal-type domain-containing protein n=1 Tax=Fonsecaea erecta TaxID=1367422 RepID=A0A178Z2N6_9EURO|nr:hypothetical protein AYL99_11790 [Fonsecaea erecta]OAP54030.1 hypothetical protein AYL99_11790 [Fonsecaea erecta]